VFISPSATASRGDFNGTRVNIYNVMLCSLAIQNRGREPVSKLPRPVKSSDQRRARLAPECVDRALLAKAAAAVLTYLVRHAAIITRYNNNNNIIFV